MEMRRGQRAWEVSVVLGTELWAPRGLLAPHSSPGFHLVLVLLLEQLLPPLRACVPAAVVAADTSSARWPSLAGQQSCLTDARATDC